MNDIARRGKYCQDVSQSNDIRVLLESNISIQVSQAPCKPQCE
jgi:hypothetical protein